MDVVTSSGPEHVRAFEAFADAAPEGRRVELVEGRIRVRPLDDGAHAETVAAVGGRMHDHGRARGLRVHTALGGCLPCPYRTGRVVPDLVVAPKGSFWSEDLYHDPAPILLLGEVTSRSTGEQDRGPKLRGYARAGIPCYLLIDRDAGEVVVFSEPSGEEYTRRDAAALSKTVALPEPLGFELDTGIF